MGTRKSTLCLLILAAAVMGPYADAEPPSRPNIVFILADDLGWRDTSVYGSTFHQTPNIDRLARRGLRFTNAYAANPLCSPTRASILTGLYPGRIGITTPCPVRQSRLESTLPETAQPEEKVVTPLSATRLRTSYPTLVKSLKELGYATGHLGKWHLGPEPYSALDHGFDVDLPHYAGPSPPSSYLAPWKFAPSLNFTGPDGQHLEDRMAEEAVKFISENKRRPFFLNYWAFSVHGPWDANKALVEKYSSRIDPSSPQRNPVYAAMIHSLDDAVGTLLDTLDELEIADRTIVVFFSDNGGIDWLDDRMRQQFGLDSPPTSNAPLRGGKASLYEGGTREPCIVVWPGRVRPDSTTDALLSSVDWYPTLLEMTGRRPSAEQKLDGISQVPALLGTGKPRDTVYCYFPHYIKASGNLPGVWVRRGDWKLIRFFADQPDGSDRFELYNLADDPGESRNLADEMHGRVAELDHLIDQHLQAMGAPIPRPNPAYSPPTEPPA